MTDFGVFSTATVCFAVPRFQSLGNIVALRNILRNEDIVSPGGFSYIFASTLTRMIKKHIQNHVISPMKISSNAPIVSVFGGLHIGIYMK